jgi:ribokinase
MAVINFGSLNFDFFYEVEDFARPGETITAETFRCSCGGKGLNQSVALARAGASVFHAGRIGQDGKPLLACLEAAGVDTRYVEVSEGKPSGHAIIQVDRNAQNSIIIHGGANQEVRSEDAHRVLANFHAEDHLLLQNEISSIPDIMDSGRKQGLTIYLNPAPMNRNVMAYPLDMVDYFIINEIEGKELTEETDPDLIIQSMRNRFPRSVTILTLGEKGVICAGIGTKFSVPADKVTAVDTTAAGDTFIGFFIAQNMQGYGLEDCVRVASHAAAICVTRRGSADSIPLREEVG